MKQSHFAAEERENGIDFMGDPLLAIEQTIAFGARAARVDEVAPRTSRAKGGRPPFPTEVMVRVLTLKHLCAIADEALEFQHLGPLSFRRVCGLTDSSSITGRNTVWMLKQRLREAGAEQAVFGEVHCKSHHGYKLSINTDNRCKLIRRLHVSTASDGDSLHFEGVLDPSNLGRNAYADKGYTSAKREASPRERGLRPKTEHKDPPLGVLSMEDQGRNQRIAKTRARVKHVFGGMEHMKVLVLKTIGLGRARFQLTLRCAVYNMRRVSQLQPAGVKPF